MARVLRLPLLLIGVPTLLAACAQPAKTLNDAHPVAMRSPRNPAHGVTEPEPKASTASAPAAVPAIIWQSADKLMGLAPEELLAALGKPARIRDEEAGRIYQYVGSDCVLDLFLYQATAGAYRVSYAEARSAHADKKPVDTCLKSLSAPVVADNAPSS